LEILPQRLEFYRAAKPGRLALPSRARFYLAAAILKFGLLFKFRPAVRRSAKFKKRKQTSCKIRLRRKNWAAL